LMSSAHEITMALSRKRAQRESSNAAARIFWIDPFINRFATVVFARGE